jgi:leader peptidase (prepilin peptidase)/N-methyltransferase
MEIVIPVFVFLTGLCVGSFLNVCIYRLPKRRSVTYPYSTCSSCGSRLQAVDLIPVFSYLALKGSCRYCGGKIPVQYPLVELTVAVLFLLAYFKYGLTVEALQVAVLFALITAVTVIDWRYLVIPNSLNRAGFILGLILLIASPDHYISNITGFLLGGGILYLIAVVLRGGIGGGDIKFAAVIGLLLGWEYLLLTLFLAFSSAGLVGAVLVLLKIKKMKEVMAFGPYLAFGSVIAALAGDWLVSWYLQFF